MQILPIFPTNIYVTKFIREYTEEEIDFVYSLLEKPNKNTYNLTSKNTNVLDESNIFGEFTDFIQAHLNEYSAKSYGFKRKQNVYITQSWLNLNKKGAKHHLHKHPNSFISGVLYIKCNSNDFIFFKNPSNINNFFAGNYSDYQTLEYQPVSVKEGTLILFPSSLEHKVMENTEDTDRISLSFNTFISGDFYDKKALGYLNIPKKNEQSY